MPTGLLAPSHLLLLGLIALLVFGPKRLPEIGRSLGHGLRGFKDSVSGTMPETEPEATSEMTAETRALPVEIKQPAGQTPAGVDRDEQQVA